MSWDRSKFHYEMKYVDQEQVIAAAARHIQAQPEHLKDILEELWTLAEDAGARDYALCRMD